jgi:hypothetical protein
MFFFKKEEPITNSVTFATAVWENDWKELLLNNEFLPIKKIANHDWNFQERILIINNVKNYPEVIEHAQKWVDKKVLTNFYIAKDFEKEVFTFFNLKRQDFKTDGKKTDDWVYYNGLAPLSAIFHTKTDYLLYMTGDAWLEKKTPWIEKSIRFMQKYPQFKVANPTWNDNYPEAKKESYRTKKDFFLHKSGFSDQCFLVKTEDFKKPIYGEIREDSHHYPNGDVFEKRVFSFMKNRSWERITFRHGSYQHKSF